MVRAMPELPEVESVRRTLEPRVVGRRVVSVEVRRGDVVRVCGGGGRGRGRGGGRGGGVEVEAGRSAPSPTAQDRLAGALLVGRVVRGVERHGKQLAVVSEGENERGVEGGAVCVHLGMTGSLILRESPAKPQAESDPHGHVVWHFEGGGELTFRDPRRFGGIWCYDSFEHLRGARWAGLGVDALSVTPGGLRRVLSRKRLGIKATLLDQRVVAGLGNIYVDELLFNAGVHPLTPAGEVGIDRRLCESLARRMRSLLRRAVEAGGSSIRDYVDGEGRPGGFQRRHRVYGRGGLRCVRRGCRATLMVSTITGRTTVWCARCQPPVGEASGANSSIEIEI